ADADAAREELGEVRSGLWIVARDARALVEQDARELHSRRFPDVVGLRLEREPPERDLLAREAADRTLDEVREEERLLLVGGVRGLGDAHRDAVLAAERGERLGVFWEARAAVPGSGVEVFLADAGVGTDAEPHRVDVGAGGVAEARQL